MKKLIILSLICLFTCSLAKAQSVVNMNFKQNPVFGVSTNDVSAVLDGQPITIGGDIVVTGGSGVYSYRWYQGDNVLSTESTITIGEPGEYALDIKDQCDCLQTVLFHITGTSGIDAIDLNDVKQITVFNIKGQLVKVINGQFVDLSNLPSGQYIINKVDAKGNIASKKVTR